MITYQVRGIVHQFKSWRSVLLVSAEVGRQSLPLTVVTDYQTVRC